MKQGDGVRLPVVTLLLLLLFNVDQRHANEVEQDGEVGGHEDGAAEEGAGEHAEKIVVMKM